MMMSAANIVIDALAQELKSKGIAAGIFHPGFK
jgi:hypothetical protein